MATNIDTPKGATRPDVSVINPLVDVSPALANTTTNYSLSGYTGLIDDTVLATKALLTITDFKAYMTYQVPRRVGEALKSGTIADPVWLDQYELITRVVYPTSINQDLLEFQNAIARGAALGPAGTAPTTILGF